MTVGGEVEDRWKQAAGGCNERGKWRRSRDRKKTHLDSNDSFMVAR